MRSNLFYGLLLALPLLSAGQTHAQSDSYSSQNGELGVYALSNSLNYKSLGEDTTKELSGFGVVVSTRLASKLGMVFRYTGQTTEFSELDVLMRYVFFGPQFRESVQDGRFRLVYDNYIRLYSELGGGRGRVQVTTLDNFNASEIVADFYSYGLKLCSALNILDFMRLEATAGYFLLEGIPEETIAFKGYRSEVTVGSTFVF